MTFIDKNIEAFSGTLLKHCSLVMAHVLILILVIFIIHFHNIGIQDKVRLRYIQDQVNAGADTIYVPKLSSKYVKDNSGWSYGQVYYHEKKEDIEFEMISLSEWTMKIGFTEYKKYIKMVNE